jgi:hypothetical protein
MTVPVVAWACHPSYARKQKKEDCGPGQPRHKVRSYLKNNVGIKGGGPLSQTPSDKYEIYVHLT